MSLVDGSHKKICDGWILIWNVFVETICISLNLNVRMKQSMCNRCTYTYARIPLPPTHAQTHTRAPKSSIETITYISLDFLAIEGASDFYRLLPMASQSTLIIFISMIIIILLFILIIYLYCTGYLFHSPCIIDMLSSYIITPSFLTPAYHLLWHLLHPFTHFYIYYTC